MRKHRLVIDDGAADDNNLDILPMTDLISALTSIQHNTGHHSDLQASEVSHVGTSLPTPRSRMESVNRRRQPAHHSRLDINVTSGVQQQNITAGPPVRRKPGKHSNVCLAQKKNSSLTRTALLLPARPLFNLCLLLPFVLVTIRWFIARPAALLAIGFTGLRFSEIIPGARLWLQTQRPRQIISRPATQPMTSSNTMSQMQVTINILSSTLRARIAHDSRHPRGHGGNIGTPHQHERVSASR